MMGEPQSLGSRALLLLGAVESQAIASATKNGKARGIPVEKAAKSL